MSATPSEPLDDTAYRFFSRHRRELAYAIYAAVAVAAYAMAFLIRFELRWPSSFQAAYVQTFPLLVGCRLASHLVFRLATGRWRYVGISDVFRLLGSSVVGSLLFSIALAVVPGLPSIPRSVLLIELVLSTYLVGGVWFGYRLIFQTVRRWEQDSSGTAKRVLIIGAGEAGSRLAHEMVTFATGYTPLGFVDDDPLKWGTRLHGLQVVGGMDDILGLVGRYRPDELITALPSLDPAALRRIVVLCEPTGLPFKVLPGIADVFEGKVHPNQLREVRVEDLLGRETVHLSLPELAEDFRDQTVLITGAAGSIGSELSRQVARHGPRRLLLLDQAESPLYFVELELRRSFPEVELQAVVGDILDRELIEALFATHRIDRTFHAAAYKHVPLMETNVREAVRNNVLGTHAIADAAGRHGCERFVLISTDKAVRPSSVMGATKSVAELVVLTAQEHYPGTTYTAVRFGNVLGSQGSVIPLFRKQIEAGDPLTVTHPDVTRFFMTISEASQLVLQASLLPQLRGRIAMLEMGEPVRILDLARNLIRLSGEVADPDTRIRYTGLRPGEKLHEELVGPREQVTPTAVPKVNLVSRSRAEALKDLLPWIDRWRIGLGDADARTALELVWSWCQESHARREVPVGMGGD